MIGATLIAAEDLRLVADAEDLGFGILTHGGEPFFRLCMVPQWISPNPLAAAKMVVNCMGPTAPRLVMDGTSRGLVGGIYCANADAISIYSEQLTEIHTAGVLFHEAVHATGHQSRLHRPYFAKAEPCHVEIDEYATKAGPFETMSPDQQREESTACLGDLLLCVMLGVIPSGGALLSEWLPRAALLSENSLRGTLADAIAAVDFLVPRPDGERLWCAELLAAG